jgi:hypothetical protein
MAAAITILVVEFILLCAMPFAYFQIGIAWGLVAGNIICAIIGAIILPGAIQGIKTRTPSRGKAIATTAMAGTAIGIGLIMALTMAFIAVFLTYYGVLPTTM